MHASIPGGDGTGTDRPTLLLVGGAAAGGHGADSVIRSMHSAHKAGLRVHVTDLKEAVANAPRVRELADAVSVLDHGDPGACADWALRTLRNEDVRVVFSSREYAQEATAAIADALGLPGNPPSAIAVIRNKDRCREALAQAGFEQPRFAVCRDRGQARAFMTAGHGGPWVVKPQNAMGSLGVGAVHGPEDLDAALDRLPDGSPFIIEDFVTGPEYSIEGVFVDGSPVVIAVTEKTTTEPPLFIEVAHVLPAPVDERVRSGLAAAAEAALRTLGLRFGAFHVEAWWTPRGPVLGEVHSRLGGDWIHRLVEYSLGGVDPTSVIIDDALGADVDRAGLTCVRAATVVFPTPPPGTVLSVSGWEAARSHPRTLHADPEIAPGDTVPPLRDSFDRRGVLIVGADDAFEARDLADSLVTALRTETAPARP